MVGLSLFNRIGLLHWLLTPLLLFSFPSAAGQQENFQKLLLQADELRSADPEGFAVIVDELGTYYNLLSEEQKLYYIYLKGFEQTFQGNFDESLVHFKRVLSHSKDSAMVIRAQASIINSLGIARRFNEGLLYLNQLLEMLPNVKSPKIRMHGLQVAAIFYNQLGEYDLGLRYSERVLDEKPEGRYECMARLTHLEAKFNLGLLTENSKEIDTGISLCQEQGEILLTNVGRTYLAWYYLDHGKHDKALELLKNNLQEAEETRYPWLMSGYFYLVAKAYFISNKIGHAERFAKKAIEESNKGGVSKPIVRSYELLYQIAIQKNDLKSALEYHQKYANSDKAHLNDIKARHLAYQLAKHEAIERNSRIKLLNKQNEVLKLEQELSKKAAQNNRLLIALLIAVVGLVILWAFKIKRSQILHKKRAEYDELTGVSNRNHFTRMADSAIRYCAKTDQEVGFILFDLDRFKSINDTYGHLTGDWVLEQVSKVCKQCGRKNDIIGRLGGEEFAILLPACNQEKALQIAELCRNKITMIETGETGHDFPVSASFGVTSAQQSGYVFKSLVSDADGAMYHAKESGRNKVVAFKQRMFVVETSEPEVETAD